MPGDGPLRNARVAADKPRKTDKEAPLLLGLHAAPTSLSRSPLICYSRGVRVLSPRISMQIRAYHPGPPGQEDDLASTASSALAGPQTPRTSRPSAEDTEALNVNDSKVQVDDNSAWKVGPRAFKFLAAQERHHGHCLGPLEETRRETVTIWENEMLRPWQHGDETFSPAGSFRRRPPPPSVGLASSYARWAGRSGDSTLASPWASACPSPSSSPSAVSWGRQRAQARQLHMPPQSSSRMPSFW